MTIYLNASSRGLPAAALFETMRAALTAEEMDAPDAFLRTQAEALETARADLAALLGAAPEAVGFSSTTSATWLAIVSQLDLAARPTPRLLLAPQEWGAHVRLLRRLAAQGVVRLETLSADADAATWAARIDDDVAAIFAPMVSSIDGERLPIEALGAAPRPESCAFVVDAAQAIGQTPIDVARLGCDALMATGRKWLRGPRGGAVFWISEALSDRAPRADIEPADAAPAVRLGLAAAARAALAYGVEALENDIRALRDEAARRAAALGLAPEAGPPATGALTLGAPIEAAARIKSALASAGFIVKFPNRAEDEPLAPIPEGTTPMRIAPHIYNTPDEIAALFETLAALL